MPIRLLSPRVADAIAAGEVIERPASIVKELVENSLDAGARRISVEILGSGRTLIRVADDGAGIPADQLGLAFLRHATSKVATLSDLEAIASLGFRGEALASVAAVADVECRSSGGRIRLRGGQVIDEGAEAPAPGTVIEVRDLFANTPARLKFLKSDATEQAACLKAVSAYAQLHPYVRFEARVEGRTALKTPGDGDLRRAIASVHGVAVAAEMLEVDREGLRGMTSQPRLSRANRDAILLAVNGRPISSRGLGFAVEECYMGSLERSRYPVAVLDLEVDPREVDVNVHPAKREVRFHDERTLFGVVQRAVRDALMGSQAYRLPLRADSSGAADWPARQMTVHDSQAALPDPAEAQSIPPASPLRALGQVLNGYLVAESAEGVVLVDQHAAHERVLYNLFLARLAGAPASSQQLLLPQTVELEPAQVAAAADYGERLASVGFELVDFGPGTLRVLAAPTETPPGRIEGALHEMLGVLADARSVDSIEKAAASLACHSAVRFGDQLDPVEQRRLLAELEAAEHSVTCPHGRPTRLLLEWQDLKRHFRRNY